MFNSKCSKMAKIKRFCMKMGDTFASIILSQGWLTIPEGFIEIRLEIIES